MKTPVVAAILFFAGLSSTTFANQLVSEADKDRIRSVRAIYAKEYTTTDGFAKLRVLAKETDTRVASELVALMAVFGLPVRGSELIHDLLKIRISEKSPGRARALLNSVDSEVLSNHRGLVKDFPYDFVSHFRFADISLVKGNRSPEVERSVARVESLTDNHPIALWLRGLKLYMTPPEDPSSLEKLGQARVCFKLFKSAIVKIVPNPRVTESISAIEAYLKKKGITPPEPTPEQYAAVKKRGWAFNKQMLEPFKKVN